MSELAARPDHPHPPAADAAAQALAARFKVATDAATRTILAWAPGRINLIGEHTDYNDGLVLPLAVDRAVALAGRLITGQRTRLYSAHDDAIADFSLSPAALADAAEGEALPRWARYVRAALAEVAARADTAPLPAFEAAIVGDVPVGGGMSSSSALTVAAAAFAVALTGDPLSRMALAQLCQRAEQRASGVLGGIMDQVTACLGRVDHAILLDCRSLAYEYLPLALPETLLVAYDTRVPHALAESEYNTRRRECEEAVALLTPAIQAEAPARAIRALRDVTLADLARYGALLPDRLLRRARHVVSENERVSRAAVALRVGDLTEVGALLSASHISLRDDYAVSCPELDAVVEIASTVPGVLGARMMGAGFGGSALLLVRQIAWPTVAASLARDYPRRTGRVGMPYVCQSADGAACVA